MVTLIDDLITQVSKRIDLDSVQIKRVVPGFRFVGTMLENGACGMCFLVNKQHFYDENKTLRDFESISDLEVVKILQFAKHSDIDLEKCVGISMLNALSQHIIKKDLETYHLLFNSDPIAHIQFSKADQVVMIGGIGALFQKIRQIVKNVIVIDDRLKNASEFYIKSPETTQEHLDLADIVLITGSALANNTLELLLKWSKNAKDIVVVGPSAGFLPEPLFERGVTILSSMQVLNPKIVLDIIAEKGGTPHFKKYCKKYNILRK